MDKEEAKVKLLELLKPGDTIYTITRHVSRSGMQRRISAFFVKGNKIEDLDWYIEQLGIAKRHKTENGLVVHGCGMNMHFWLVYQLGGVLYSDGCQLPSGMRAVGGYAFSKVTL